ncbi:glycosyltransferase [Tumidithrix elongata RA019]|uniref:Glycosyltransferase n=1 Tax=Tumidithrix elongata BACA0141 TaxID=2716417 RepID=A0AAW9PTQ0_9CYAN|nr:glycosyltransferase [Tumidithrix elongata RA019]
MSPEISIIIPAYNAASTIAASIQSVQNQTIQDWELFVIDDGSTDRTLACLQSIAEQDRRIQVISHTNQGVSATRNLGIEQAQGEFITFLDADDLWLPDKLAAHMQHMQFNHELAVSFGRVAFINQEGKLTGQISTSQLKDLQLADLLYENPTTTTSNLFVRRRIFEQAGFFATDMSFAEDLEWLCRAIWLTKGKIEGIDRVLMQYRTSQGGLSSDLERMETGWEVLMGKVKAYAPDEVQKHYAIARAIHLRYLARRASRLGLPPKVGVDFMNRAFQSDLRIWFRQPHRTLLTALVTYGRYIYFTIVKNKGKR